MKLSRRRRGGTGSSRVSWSRARRWLVSLAVLVVAFLGGYLVAAELIFSAPGTTAVPGDLVTVPEVTGSSLREAESALAARDLAARVTHRPSLGSRSEGTVLSQRPLAGQLAPPGSQVYLGVSGGPGRVTVPGVRGLTGDRARSVLHELGLETGVREEASSVRKGEVVATEPRAGTKVTLPAEVVVVVSKGPAVSTVPALVGRHVEDVMDLLTEARLELGAVEFDPEATAAPGRVIGQSPPAGYALRTGGSVSIRVAGTREDWRPPLRDTSLRDTIRPSVP